MAIDYAEKEREFLALLEEDTGRDLGKWMVAIAGSGHTRRNDIIDWLRQQGFMFSRASWLERIHANGGVPIYATGLAAPAAPPLITEDETRAALRAPAPRPPTPQVAAPPTEDKSATAQRDRAPTQPEPAPAPAPPRDSGMAALAPLLAGAKAYRPLATYLVAEIARLAPDVGFTGRDTMITAAAGAPFAVLAVSPRELRLALALPGTALEPPWGAVKLAQLPADVASRLTHMAVLTDARQIDAAFRAAISTAAAHARAATG